MAKPRNQQTDFIRECVNLWMAGNRDTQFTVSEICQALKIIHPVLDHLDLTKYVSNELMRREKLGILTSVPGCKETTVNGCGRPARLYQKRYCLDSINVLIQRSAK